MQLLCWQGQFKYREEKPSGKNYKKEINSHLLNYSHNSVSTSPKQHNSG